MQTAAGCNGDGACTVLEMRVETGHRRGSLAADSNGDDNAHHSLSG